MAKKNHPLEIILRHNGLAELVDANDRTLWSSDADEDFKEEFSDEFLTEDDIDDLLSYLAENKIITELEARYFESGDWDVTEESLDENAVQDGHDKRLT